MYVLRISNLYIFFFAYRRNTNTVTIWYFTTSCITYTKTPTNSEVEHIPYVLLRTSKKCYFFPIIPFFLVFRPKPLFLYNKWCPFSPMSSSIPAVLWDHFFCCALPTTAKDDDWKKGAHHPKINGLFSLLSSVYPIKSVFLPNKNSFWIIFFVVVVRP